MISRQWKERRCWEKRIKRQKEEEESFPLYFSLFLNLLFSLFLSSSSVFLSHSFRLLFFIYSLPLTLFFLLFHLKAKKEWLLKGSDHFLIIFQPPLPFFLPFRNSRNFSLAKKISSLKKFKIFCTYTRKQEKNYNEEA